MSVAVHSIRDNKVRKDKFKNPLYRRKLFMPISKTWRWTRFIIISLIISSCTVSKLDLSLDFYTDPDNLLKPHDGVLGVDEFLDLRPQATTSDAKKWIGFIPGVLWIEFISEIPDTYTVFSDYKSGPFTFAVAMAIYEDVKRKRLFEKTLFLPIDRYTKIDYRLEGILNRTFLKETGYYYGSGFYAWFTRIIGLPYVSYEFSIDITLRLRCMATNEIIWIHELKGSRIDKFNSVYKLTAGKEGKHILSYNFSEILKEQMPSTLKSMREAIEEL